MNLTKEQLKQGGLGLIMVLLGLYVYYTMLINPLSYRKAHAEKRIAELQPKLREARTRINRTRAIEQSDPNAAYAESVRKNIEELVPQEAAIVWLPNQIEELFRTNGVNSVSTSFKSSSNDAELPGFIRSQWEIELPKASYHKVGETIAALENRFGLLQIQRVEISSTPANSEQQNVTLLFSTVTRP